MAKKKAPATPPAVAGGKYLVAKKSVESVLANLDSVTISSQADAETANSFLGKIKSTSKEIDSIYKPEISKIEAPAKVLRAEMKRLQGLLSSGETTIKEKLQKWILDEQEKAAIRRQEQIDEDTKKLRKSGLTKSEAALVAKETAPAVETPALDGLVLADKWEADLDDSPGAFLRLLESILSGDTPREYVTFDSSFATKQAIAFKDPERAPPGVRFFNSGSLRKSV
jgi:hypothetical protein